MEKFLDILADWSERHDTPFEIFRADDRGTDLKWCVVLRFKDSRGWFTSEVLDVRYPKKRELDEDFRERIISRLKSAVIVARRERIKQLTKCDPRRRAA